VRRSGGATRESQYLATNLCRRPHRFRRRVDHTFVTKRISPAWMIFRGVGRDLWPEREQLFIHASSFRHARAQSPPSGRAKQTFLVPVLQDLNRITGV